MFHTKLLQAAASLTALNPQKMTTKQVREAFQTAATIFNSLAVRHVQCLEKTSALAAMAESLDRERRVTDGRILELLEVLVDRLEGERIVPKATEGFRREGNSPHSE